MGPNWFFPPEAKVELFSSGFSHNQIGGFPSLAFPIGFFLQRRRLSCSLPGFPMIGNVYDEPRLMMCASAPSYLGYLILGWRHICHAHSLGHSRIQLSVGWRDSAAYLSHNLANLGGSIVLCFA